MREWLIVQLGFPWYAYGWPQVLVGGGLLWLLLFVFRLMGRWRAPMQWRLRWGLALPIAFVAVTWDVWLLSREANQLCREQGGLHIYKTVEADGFIGVSSIKYWNDYGFSYVEAGGKGKRFHITLVDGEENYEVVEQYDSRYATNSKTYVAVGDGIFRSQYWIEDVKTGEVLGELVTFTGDRGWADNWLPNALLLPVEHSPWICGDLIDPDKPRYNNHYVPHHIVKATLKPKTTSTGAEQ